VGDLPVILMELNNSGGIVKTYIYANSQIIAQHTGDHEADRYFYLHDRLGSVRQTIDTSGNVKNRYTYKPFGELYPAPDFEEMVDNPFRFTGQYYDSEIDEYYLRARQYDPHIARFTARDPVFGKFKEPFTLHVYLYCLNDPVNRFDPEGRFYNLISPILTGAALYAHGLNLSAYAASSENWKFFDLGEATFQFMPVGMAVAAFGVRTTTGRIVGTAMGTFIEQRTHITGMGLLEGVAMDPYAYYLYCLYMLKERGELGVWSWDMQGFLEWKWRDIVDWKNKVWN
jgi:RHS repeat-associated protein